MGLLQRIGDLLRSNINDLISRAEDPERMLNAAIEDMQRQLVEAKSRVAMSIADEKRLQKQAEGERSKAEDWEAKAMSAVRAGRDDLAVEALSRKKEHGAAAQQYQEQLDGQRSAVDELKRALSELSAKLDETKRKRTLLMARAKRAEAQRQLADTLTHKSHSSAMERLQMLESRVEREEARAEANWELASSSQTESYERDLAAEIEMLGEGDGDQELAALKAKVQALDELAEGESKPRAALGSGASEGHNAPSDGSTAQAGTAAEPAESAERTERAQPTNPEGRTDSAQDDDGVDESGPLDDATPEPHDSPPDDSPPDDDRDDAPRKQNVG